MNVIRPGRRGTDRWGSAHERARSLAADRLAGPIAAADADWLERHLAGCPACTVVAEEYTQQRRALRAIGAASAPTPPRDLWARTAAAIERAGPPPAERRRRLFPRPSPIPIGVLSGALVVLVVVGVSLLPKNPPSIALPTPPVAVVPSESSAVSKSPMPTPFAVAPGEVAWIRLDEHGQFGYFEAHVDEVCPGRAESACAPLDDTQRTKLGDLNAPTTVVRNPKTDQIVVVDTAPGDTGGTVYVVALDGSSAPPETTPPPTDAPSPTVPVTSSPSPTVEPTSTATPEPLLTPGTTPSETPTESPVPTDSAEPSEGPTAIASGIVLVGDTAAYSPDGAWFAFSARPVDGSQGPDVYLWRVGDPMALPVTSDHRSVFSAWYGPLLLGSRAVPTDGAPHATPAPSEQPSASSVASAEPSTEASVAPSATPVGDFSAEAFIIDPATLEERPLDAVPFWRPSVDPLAELAVYWEGTLEPDATGTTWRPKVGRLLLATWSEPFPDAVSPGPSGSPGAGAEPSESAAPTEGATSSSVPSASPTLRPNPFGPPQVLEAGRIGDWDARWDSDGSHLAVWVTDDPESGIGQLRLYAIDRRIGRIDPSERPLVDVPAMAGFSLGEGRLAWATPPGQDGEGSRVQVLAWDGDQVGTVETAPGQDPVLIIR